MAFSNFKAEQIAVTATQAVFGMLVAALTAGSSISHALTDPLTFNEYETPSRAPTNKDNTTETGATANPWEAYQKPGGRDELADASACESYGFAKGTNGFGNCMLQLRRERIAFQIEQMRYLQQAIAATEARTQALREAEAQARREAQAEREGQRRRSAASSDRLRQLSEDMLCPKQYPGPFAPPVAGCGSNKNAPRPSTTNIIVNTRVGDCEYRTAAGCR
jgi:hypothetical protein